MWPGIYGNPGGGPAAVSRLRKRASQASRFMLQMMQMPFFSNENEEQQSSENSHDSPSATVESSFDFESGEEGLAIRIAAEVISLFYCCSKINIRLRLLRISKVVIFDLIFHLKVNDILI